MNKLPDIGNDTEPEIKKYINRVAVYDIKVPITISNRSLHEQVQASVSMLSDLDNNIRTISMSIFLRILREYIYKDFSINTIREILEKFKTVSKNKSYITEMVIKFDLSFNRESPKSHINFPIYYSCILKGQLIGNEFKLFKCVKIPYTSYCPCSKSLVDDAGMGISHNQKSYCNLYVELLPNDDVQFIELIELIENNVVNKVHPILKRIDEQHVAIIASENTYFVEDIIRKITNELDTNKIFKDWIIRVTHEESLHQHYVGAINWKGIENGFNQHTIIG